MDSSLKKAFSIKVKVVTRILKEYKSYKIELEAYDLNEVSQDKKKNEFYQESKGALADVEKKLIDYYQQLKAFIIENEDDIQDEQEASVKADNETANSQMAEVQALLPGAC